MSELSLIIQSVCLEASVGLMLFLVLYRFINKDLNGKMVSILASALTVIGIAASITHLGQPLRAFNSLFNLGSSWMSRETLFVALLAGCCVLCAAVNLFKPTMKLVLRVLEWAGALIGIVLIYIMGSIYAYSSTPVWQGANTYIEFYTTAIIIGSVLFYAVTYKQHDKKSNKIFGAIAIAALAVQIAGSEIHMASLASGSQAERTSAEILSTNGTLIALKWVLFIVGVGLFCMMRTEKLSGIKQQAPVMAGGPQQKADGEAVSANASYMAWISVAAVVVAAFIAKILFFTSMVTIGIGVQ